MKEEKLYMAFKMLDLDGNGKISKDELKTVLGGNRRLIAKYSFFLVYYYRHKQIQKGDESYQGKDDRFWDDMIGEVDKNGDGEVCLAIRNDNFSKICRILVGEKYLINKYLFINKI